MYSLFASDQESACDNIFLKRVHQQRNERNPAEQDSQPNFVGMCGPLPKTLTLLMTKICDFPYPVYDLNQKFDTILIYCLTL